MKGLSSGILIHWLAGWFQQGLVPVSKIDGPTEPEMTKNPVYGALSNTILIVGTIHKVTNNGP